MSSQLRTYFNGNWLMEKVGYISVSRFQDRYIAEVIMKEDRARDRKMMKPKANGLQSVGQKRQCDLCKT